VGFARVKNKKSIWRAKPQSRQGLRKSNQSDHKFFAPAFRPPTVGRQAGLCALPAAVGFARVKNKKSIWRAKPPSRQGLRKSNQSDYNFFAPAFRPPTVGRRTSNAPIIPTQIHQEAMGTDGYF